MQIPQSILSRMFPQMPTPTRLCPYKRIRDYQKLPLQIFKHSVIRRGCGRREHRGDRGTVSIRTKKIQCNMQLNGSMQARCEGEERGCWRMRVAVVPKRVRKYREVQLQHPSRMFHPTVEPPFRENKGFYTEDLYQIYKLTINLFIIDFYLYLHYFLYSN